MVAPVGLRAKLEHSVCVMSELAVEAAKWRGDPGLRTGHQGTNGPHGGHDIGVPRHEYDRFAALGHREFEKADSEGDVSLLLLETNELFPAKGATAPARLEPAHGYPNAG